MSFAYSFVAIIIVAVVTGLIRATPFLIFNGKKELPETAKFLGNTLPPSIMIILVLYCLRNIQVTTFPYGLAEIISVSIIIVIQFMKKKTFLSIFLGTAIYMILTRTVFS